MGIERYRAILPSWEEFAESSARPEAVTLRVNVARETPSGLSRRLEASGFRLEAVPGLPNFMTVVEQPYPVSLTVEHWLGLFYLQQAVTGVAPLALDPRPGERILDLCAAPGGKASHLAERLGGSGIVVAGDSNEGRIKALLGNLYRLGHLGVLVVSADGRAFPGGASFDRVLVDVPCSGEGNLRRRGGLLPREAGTASFRGHISGVQRALVRRAVELVRPGGVVLYVTCTFAPEENEDVVAWALERLPVTLEPIELDLPHAPGLTGFAGREYPPELEQAWRLYPHHLDSGGLFMARLRRADGALAPSDGWSAPPPTFPDRPEEREASRLLVEQGLEQLRERMGVPDEALAGREWLVRGGSVWMHACRPWPASAWGEEWEGGRRRSRRDAWRVIAAGVRAFRVGSGGRVRPTNDLFRCLDGALRDHVVDLAATECVRLLESGELPLAGSADGHVALRLGGHVIGRGWTRSGRLHSEVPKAQARTLLRALEAVRA